MVPVSNGVTAIGQNIPHEVGAEKPRGDDVFASLIACPRNPESCEHTGGDEPYVRIPEPLTRANPGKKAIRIKLLAHHVEGKYVPPSKPENSIFGIRHLGGCVILMRKAIRPEDVRLWVHVLIACHCPDHLLVSFFKFRMVRKALTICWGR